VGPEQIVDQLGVIHMSLESGREFEFQRKAFQAMKALRRRPLQPSLDRGLFPPPVQRQDVRIPGRLRQRAIGAPDHHRNGQEWLAVTHSAQLGAAVQ